METKNIALTKEEKKILIANSDDVFLIMKDVLKREGEMYFEREHFWVMGLNERYYAQSLDLIILGKLHIDMIDPSDVYFNVMGKQSRYSIIIHNRPNDSDLEPTSMEIDIADLLYQTAKIAKTQLIECIIMSMKKHNSFVKSGVLAQVALSIRYITTYELRRRWNYEKDKEVEEAAREARVEGTEVGLEEGLRRKASEIAIQMKKDGLDIELISKYTNLSKEEIKRL